MPGRLCEVISTKAHSAVLGRALRVSALEDRHVRARVTKGSNHCRSHIGTAARVGRAGARFQTARQDEMRPTTASVRRLTEEGVSTSSSAVCWVVPQPQVVPAERCRVSGGKGPKCNALYTNGVRATTHDVARCCFLRPSGCAGHGCPLRRTTKASGICGQARTMAERRSGAPPLRYVAHYEIVSAARRS
jgi:hypothetical protein